MPKIASKAKRVAYLYRRVRPLESSSDVSGHRGKAKELDMAGASVFRGLMGYGANSRIHTASIVDLVRRLADFD